MLESNRLLDVNGVAEIFGCSRRHVFFLIKRGKLRAVKLSTRATRISAAEVERFIAENTREVTPEGEGEKRS